MNTHPEHKDQDSEPENVLSDYFAALLCDSPTVAEPQTADLPSYQLIRIGGLTLGVATRCITGIVAAPTQWAPLDDPHAWVLGAYRDHSAIYSVVDTAALLVPGSALQSDVAGGRAAVLLADCRWALACDGIGERITPDPAQVNWRGAQGKRPWLAGTLSAPSCALLDVSELLKLLDAG